jgi:hypothetical protein
VPEKSVENVVYHVPTRRSWPLPGGLDSLGMKRMRKNSSNGGCWVYTTRSLVPRMEILVYIIEPAHTAATLASLLLEGVN